MHEGLDVYGLLIKPHAVIPSKALAVAIHGGGGTPELAAGILGPTNYNDMGRRLVRRGHIVWMPSCYERSSFEENYRDAHKALDLKANLVGSSLSAIDAYCIIRGTESMLSHFGLQDAGAVAVGLSYGGFRALEVCALSEIYRACISSCYFNDRRTILESKEDGSFIDWYFPNVLAIATDIELCRLICPRPLFIEVGQNDELFPVNDAIEASKQVERLYADIGIADLYAFDAFEGGHEFSGVNAFEFLDKLGL